MSLNKHPSDEDTAPQSKTLESLGMDAEFLFSIPMERFTNFETIKNAIRELETEMDNVFMCCI